MKNKSKKMMLFSLVVMLGFSFVSLIVAFSIKNIPENISYVYVIDCQVKCNTIREKNFEAPRRESEN